MTMTQTAKGSERRLSHHLARAWLDVRATGAFPDLSFFCEGVLNGSMPLSFRIDLDRGADQPVIGYLGSELAKDAPGIVTGSMVTEGPFNSTFSNVAEHYLEAISAQAPIEFEGRHNAKDGHARYYRGLLLPLSSDGQVIDAVAGIVTWCEVH